MASCVVLVPKAAKGAVGIPVNAGLAKGAYEVLSKDQVLTAVLLASPVPVKASIAATSSSSVTVNVPATVIGEPVVNRPSPGVDRATEVTEPTVALAATSCETLFANKENHISQLLDTSPFDTVPVSLVIGSLGGGEIGISAISI